jgi:UDP-GlcNAc:undecaprenyl-phosphate GlcNAc-1-phosphate transferase
MTAAQAAPFLRTAVISIAASLLAMPFVIRMATRRGWVVPPSSNRWHRRPVALCGGIGILFAVSVGLLVTGRVAAAWLVVPIVALSILGFVDDRRLVGPGKKLLVEALIAVWVIWRGERFLPGAPEMLSVPLTMVWIVGVTNSLNLLDNMDGLAGGVATAVGAMAALVGLVQGDHLTALVGLATCAATLGYLPFNFPRARIFMGDCGSLLLGFLAAWLALRVGRHATTVFQSLLLYVAVAGVPLLDTSLVTVARLRAGRRVQDGGRDHTSHRLVYLGHGETSAVSALVLLALTGLPTLLLTFTGARAAAIAAGLLHVAVLGYVWWYVTRVDPYSLTPATLPVLAVAPAPGGSPVEPPRAEPRPTSPMPARVSRPEPRALEESIAADRRG